MLNSMHNNNNAFINIDLVMAGSDNSDESTSRPTIPDTRPGEPDIRPIESIPRPGEPDIRPDTTTPRPGEPDVRPT